MGWQVATDIKRYDADKPDRVQVTWRYERSRQFAVWHIGARIVTLYGPEGSMRDIAHIPFGEAAGVDEAKHLAALWGALESEKWGDTLYGDE